MAFRLRGSLSEGVKIRNVAPRIGNQAVLTDYLVESEPEGIASLALIGLKGDRHSLSDVQRHFVNIVRTGDHRSVQFGHVVRVTVNRDTEHD